MLFSFCARNVLSWVSDWVRVAVQRAEVGLLLGDGLAGEGEVVERLDDVRCRLGVGLRHLHELPDVGVERRQVRVHLLQVGVQRDQRVPELHAPALQRLRDRGQRHGQVLRLDGGQLRQQVVQDGLDLDRVPGVVLADHAAVGKPLRHRGLRQDEVHVALAEQRGGHHLGGHVGRQRADHARLQGELQRRAVAVGRDRAHLADLHAADQHLCLRVQLVAHVAGVQGDHVHAGELLVVQRQAEPDQHADDGEEDQAGHPEPCLAHPATRTVVVAPQMARLMKKLTTLMTTMEARTARPTATPTPAGPPLAR